MLQFTLVHIYNKKEKIHHIILIGMHAKIYVQNIIVNGKCIGQWIDLCSRLAPLVVGPQYIVYCEAGAHRREMLWAVLGPLPPSHGRCGLSNGCCGSLHLVGGLVGRQEGTGAYRGGLCGRELGHWRGIGKVEHAFRGHGDLSLVLHADGVGGNGPHPRPLGVGRWVESATRRTARHGRVQGSHLPRDGVMCRYPSLRCTRGCGDGTGECCGSCGGRGGGRGL